MDQNFINVIESHVKSKISSTEILGGGDTGFSFQLNCDNNKSYFFKYLINDTASENIRSEVHSLEKLKATKTCSIPEIQTVFELASKSGLLLEWVPRKIPETKDLENFGREVARLHQNSNETFGWDHDNFISILKQNNNKHKTWTEFYLTERIEPLLKQGVDQGILTSTLISSLSNLEQRLIDELPLEKPSLLHGDMWSGNFIVAKNSQTYLIDPSCYYGHREMDLAMSLLFGSFSRPFYVAYQEFFPLKKGFESRIEIHQLYPLLVHAVLFQGHYIKKVVEILQK